MRFLVLLWLMLLCGFASAGDVRVMSANDDSMITELAQNSSWLDLLHYHQIGVISPYESQIDDAAFFLSPLGQSDPKAELLATIVAFQTPYEGNDLNQAAQCLYPARLSWLKKQSLGIDFIEPECPEFQDWFNRINGESIYLVFPAAYLNSPSSMYGHTLLRVKKKGNDSPLLDYAVNYAANANPEDNSLVFSYKGLTGGYPGVVSVTPYYEKVKEYNFLESRDIWEYKLDFTQQEVNQFIRHVWEVRNTYIEYYFFSENCSYQLLAMLDASSDRLNTTRNFNYWAIPADTVRELKEAGVLLEVSYRPSVVAQMEHMLESLNDEQVREVKALVLHETLSLDGLSDFTEHEQAQILEVAYQYSRYLSAREKSTLAYLNNRSIRLLSLRSKYDATNVFTPVDTPQIRDDEGHKTQRIGVTFGETEGNTFGLLEYRPSYHDLLDAKGGYLEGAELSMFSGSLGVSEDNSLRIEEISFINIRSLAPSNALVTPKSWQINGSLIRDFVVDDALVFRLKGGAGMTEKVSNHLFTLLINGSASVGDQYQESYQQKYRLQFGPQLQWLYSGDTHRVMASYEYLDDVDQHAATLKVAKIEWSYLVDPDWQIRVKLEQQKQDSMKQNTSQVSLLHYF
ncbi:DUF4105 domain-containing protein [Marinomonas sp. M1K-6]|uniref:DUF4105 domain-containing protein n=1 Tax=Marinomonas profundi TaxID=2726122 RepID=A0A847QWZ3_9GAMM|nr:DUF4105 domain-containing protein [Marinomonas profundi]NLQ16809.1 DUF4105 domain-containing protein [Marinomonas profundi]UDV02542.1 DUF4105 domain-containing protein [Marinomonas profundi]